MKLKDKVVYWEPLPNAINHHIRFDREQVVEIFGAFGTIHKQIESKLEANIKSIPILEVQPIRSVTVLDFRMIGFHYILQHLLILILMNLEMLKILSQMILKKIPLYSYLICYPLLLCMKMENLLSLNHEYFSIIS